MYAGKCDRIGPNHILISSCLQQKTPKECRRGFGSGADDYHNKPFTTEYEGGLRVGFACSILKTPSWRPQAMPVQSTHDALTGVWNRGTILETLDRGYPSAGALLVAH